MYFTNAIFCDAVQCSKNRKITNRCNLWLKPMFLEKFYSLRGHSNLQNFHKALILAFQENSTSSLNWIFFSDFCPLFVLLPWHKFFQCVADPLLASWWLNLVSILNLNSISNCFHYTNYYFNLRTLLHLPIPNVELISVSLVKLKLEALFSPTGDWCLINFFPWKV